MSNRPPPSSDASRWRPGCTVALLAVVCAGAGGWAGAAAWGGLAGALGGGFLGVLLGATVLYSAATLAAVFLNS